MYYDACNYKRGNRTYRRELLRESRRVKGKVVKETVANVTDWPEAVKVAVRQALDANRGGGQSGTLAESLAGRPGFCLEQGKSVGALFLLHHLAGELGMPEILGADRQGRLALWQVLARMQDQGSRLSAVRLARGQAVAEVLGLTRFSEDDLYANLDWLAERQSRIEERLFRARYAPGQKPSFYLYDVTSTYLEGVMNELGAFGYNRDGKRGKKQLVVGLLTDQDGWPLALEVFRGNTADPDTVASQIGKLTARFGGGEVTLVGDRGMLKSRQIDGLPDGMHYITAITKPQIESLLKAGTLQMELFDAPVAEVLVREEAVRYVLRRNPVQAERVAARRKDQLATWQDQVQKAQTYLAEHPRAQPDSPAWKHLLSLAFLRCRVRMCLDLLKACVDQHGGGFHVSRCSGTGREVGGGAAAQTADRARCPAGRQDLAGRARGRRQVRGDGQGRPGEAPRPARPLRRQPRSQGHRPASRSGQRQAHRARPDAALSGRDSGLPARHHGTALLLRADARPACDRGGFAAGVRPGRDLRPGRPRAVPAPVPDDLP